MVAECIFPHSKHFHTTVLAASPQNVRSCTHILPITEDRCSPSYLCVTPYYYPCSSCSSFSVMHFPSPVCASYVSRICVTFNHPSSWHYSCNCSIQSNLLFLFLHSFFSTFFFSALCRLQSLAQIVLRVCTKPHSVCVFFSYSFS